MTVAADSPHPPVDASSAGVAVRARGVRHVFAGGTTAIERIDLDVVPGEFVALLGPSGCGKSTFLRLVAGLATPTAGTVEVVTAAGAAIDPRSDVAFVFQDASLLPWRTTLHNAALPLELQGVPAEARLRAAAEALSLVGLDGFAERYPAQLSGGMRMRVSIARALCTRPKLLLLDEPFAALDEITRQRLDELLRRLWAERRMTVLFVTHSTQEAAFLADRAVVMSARPGRIALDHPIDLPPDRDGLLRADVRFARHARTLYEALDGGEPRQAQ